MKATHTCRPRDVCAIRWTSDNYEKIITFIGWARFLAVNYEHGWLYLYTVAGPTCVRRDEWLYFDERRDLHALSAQRFAEEFDPVA
jgi:hypothetical protein